MQSSIHIGDMVKGFRIKNSFETLKRDKFENT